MNTENMPIQSERKIPNSICPFPEIENYTLAIGSKDSLVHIIQIMLSVLKLYYDAFGTVPVGGVYDKATENAVKEFQKANGMDMSGCVDFNTWNRLAEEYNTALWENQ